MPCFFSLLPGGFVQVFSDARDERGDVFAKKLHDHGTGDGFFGIAIFDGVVNQPGANRILIRPGAGQNQGNRQRMPDIGDVLSPCESASGRPRAS